MAAGRKTGGRTKGSLNKSTSEIKILAQQHGEAAINRLAELMIWAESEQAQIAAAKELLDRAYGKSTQAVELAGADGGPIEQNVTQRISDETRSVLDEIAGRSKG